MKKLSIKGHLEAARNELNLAKKTDLGLTLKSEVKE